MKGVLPMTGTTVGRVAEKIEDLLPEEIAGIIEHIDYETLVEIIVSLPIGTAAEPNKRLALEVAEKLNYDQGQAFYRFAVLVTRLI